MRRLMRLKTRLVLQQQMVVTQRTPLGGCTQQERRWRLAAGQVGPSRKATFAPATSGDTRGKETLVSPCCLFAAWSRRPVSSSESSNHVGPCSEEAGV
jgi:hypothetical protein